MLHGADYNPEQWLDYPEVFEEDLRLMKLANVNVMSIGMFSWAKLEPEEGVFDFSWMDNVIDRLHENGVSIFLSTPSGARPTWMSEKYPEVLRVSERRVRNLHGNGLYDHETNNIQLDDQNPLGLTGEYEVRELCDLIHLEGAKALAYYGKDFYQGRPALTVNQFGKGQAYYMAARQKLDFNRDFYQALAKDLRLKRVIEQDLPVGVTAQVRSNETTDFIFVLNFNNEVTDVELDQADYTDALTNETVSRKISLKPFGVEILRRAR